jgi:chromosome segregation ATPase
MFGPKKPRVSKDSLKKAVVSANKKLVSANSRLKKDIEVNKKKLKGMEDNYEAHRKALEDMKEVQVYAENELEGVQFEVADVQTSLKKALSKLAKLTEDSNALKESNKELEDKSAELFKSIEALEKKEEELDGLTVSLKQIRKEEADGQETLELLAIELNELDMGVEAYTTRKDAAESEFSAFKMKIERERATVHGELSNIKDRMAQSTLECGKEMGRLDKAIAERISELQDMDLLLAKKDYEFSTVQSKISTAKDIVKDAEQRADYILDKAQEKVAKVKGDFKDWKVQALDEVARKKMKGQIENIDKAGLGEVLNG